MTDLALGYAEGRERMRRWRDDLVRGWPQARLESHPLAGAGGLATDVLWAEAGRPEQIVVITSGLHGIEGHLGAAMLDLFVREVTPRLDARTTSLAMVHPINPWGMKHGRRVNANGVDLNRNFVWEPSGRASAEEPYDRRVNPDYRELGFLNPARPVRARVRTTLEFGYGLARGLGRLGVRALSRATLLGQYEDPRGVYFGGHRRQEETACVEEVFERALGNCTKVVILDMHSGYGPRWQMSLVGSPLDPEPAAETEKRVRYPRVVKATGDEFYAINGDMIDFAYRMRDLRHPGRRLFAAALEFGTFGESFPALLRSLRITIFENQAFWHDAPPRTRGWIEREWCQLYFPDEARWWRKARADARQAFEGILRAEGMLA